MKADEIREGQTVVLNNGDKARIDSVKDGTIRGTRTATNNGITYSETWHRNKFLR